jgi:hypothetical protein
MAAGVLLTVCAGGASCVSGQPPYDPDRLGNAQVAAVGKICQTVVGVDPSEPLVSNLWPGDPDPASTTNNYRGCVASLSNSLLSSASARLEAQAGKNCGSEGLEPYSPQLADCVLEATRAQSARHLLQTQPVGLVVTPYSAKTDGSDSSEPEILRRERLACMEIGLEPSQRAFATCVRGLRDVLSASEMNADYEN